MDLYHTSSEFSTQNSVTSSSYLSLLVTNCNINATTCENHVKVCLRLGRLKITTNINCLLPALRTRFLKKRWHNNVYRSVYQVAVLNSVLASQRHHCCSKIKQTLHCGVETDKDAKSGFFCLSTRRKFIQSCNH